MSTATKNTNWDVSYSVNAAGEKTVSFDTDKKYIDRDISVKINTPAASVSGQVVNATNATISNTDTSGVSIQGKANVTAAGWIDSSKTSSTQYVTGVNIENNKTFVLQDPLNTWTWTVDANGNVTIV